MAILVAICSLFVSTGISITAYNQIDALAEYYDKHFPIAHVADNRLTVDNAEPVEYKGQSFQIAMDVTGNTYTRDTTIPVALFFLNDKIILDAERGGVTEYQYSQLPETITEISADTIRSLQRIASFFVLMFSLILVFLDWTIQTALMTMIGSFVVGIVAAFFRILLPRNEQLKISITAAVPMIVLMALEHLLLLREGYVFGILPLPNSLFTLNMLVFGLFLVLGSRGYLLPYIPKDSE